ncbi:DUF1499 domain-containing protein [Tuberibacillus calidus]|uniref:DUF1499 domain-containing protein n=1 Tax=Tuberibacillus calidus TaxID=340097 RepID=UPI00042900E5|nr:DUF1499 domain-containing protein [Tuberibacillus calidus]
MEHKTFLDDRKNGKMAPTPKTAKCIASNHENKNRFLMPISYKNLSLDKARAILFEVLKTIPKMTVDRDEGQYLHAVAKTFIAEFLHDVEFFFDEEKKELHFRSASRFGWTDFGANKRRMQAVVSRFLQLAEASDADAFAMD